MAKKISISLFALAAFALGIAGMSAYEAHIINVTATIENAVDVDTSSMDFGTVYPQEAIDKTFEMGLSQSFVDQDRVDTVDYIIRQKPKCWSPVQQAYGVVDEDVNGDFFCVDGGDFEILPILCPYLSKHEMTEDGVEENDSDGINAFHGPIKDWNMQDTLDTQVAGQLAAGIDTTDEWQVDLRVPCFEGFCAQDWDDFVTSNNPLANPDEYVLPADARYEILGCDLWVEVSGVNQEQGGVVISTCTDNDNDSFAVEGADCGLVDCDDGEITIFPGADEVCDDQVDNDCDQEIDCADIDCVNDPACQVGLYCTDEDLDGYGAGTERADCAYAEEDCDDGEYDINPGVAEICNGVDDNCNGNIDEDWPELGQTCVVGLGLCERVGEYICNPNNPASISACSAVPGPPAGEVCNDQLDNDCDGLVDDDDEDCQPTSIEAGELVINEIMQDPDVPADKYGEWIELYNATDHPIDINGCVLSDNGTDSHIIDSSVIIASHGYSVLANEGNESLNGGLNEDYVYSGVALANGVDEVVLTCGLVEIDRVEYDDGATFPDPNGASMNLDSFLADNNVGSNWCDAMSVMASGDKGTPGTKNDDCGSSVVYFEDMGATDQFGYDHDYSGARLSFVYGETDDNTIRGRLTGYNLKPYATYQLKFEGKPTCKDGGTNDQTNEYIGYRGRWWNDTDGNNATDVNYESGDGDCYIGYLVWDFFTANADGVIEEKFVETANSYHVLWCSGGTCGGTNNSSLQNLSGAQDPPGFPYCDANHVNGELQRPGTYGCGDMSFDPGSYDLNFILNEENFHQYSFGDWTAVMNTDINFTIN